jgi:hypothetical protein
MNASQFMRKGVGERRNPSRLIFASVAKLFIVNRKGKTIVVRVEQ